MRTWPSVIREVHPMHQQLRSFYRHLLQGLTVGLSTLGLFSSAARSHHDDVPDPPPQSSSNHLAALPNLVPTAITVSGISSGGFFAHQFHVAYSKLVNGAGIIAGGPFACVENVPNPYYVFWTVPLDRVSAATVACTHYFGSSYFGLSPSTPKAESSLDAIRQARRRRAIDDPANLADDRVWLFHGEHDEIVPEPVARSLEEVYRALGVLDLQADWNDHGRAASHGMPVERFTGQSKFPTRECEEHDPPFIIQCGFDATRSLLQHLYPENFNGPSTDPHRDGTLMAFDQSEFFTTREAISLSRVGYIYVPHTCAAEPCRLHVAFHGCKQDLESVHDDFIRDAGYNQWAASNSIVVLYPQATGSAANPNRCWDFWGYSGSGYFGKDGPQMRAVKSMVDRLLGPGP